MSKKIRPIEVSESDASALRKKLNALVSRMKRDFEVELKPLIKRLTEEQREQTRERLEKTNEILHKRLGDAVNMLTAYEASRRLRTLKSKVVGAAMRGEFKDAVQRSTGEWLIPEESLREYAEKKGIELSAETLFDRFVERLDALTAKYNSLIEWYKRTSEKETEKMFQAAKKRFMKQFKDQVGIDILKQLSEKGLREAFDKQVEANVFLIKSIPQTYFAKIQQMVISSTTGSVKYEGGLVAAIEEMTSATREKAKLIARDQTSKAISTFSRLRYENLGSKKYIWRNVKDRRVAGNPNGLYPKVDPKSKYHGDHWKREGKIFSWDQPPPDGHPGMPINCRCFAEPIFEDD